MCKWWSATFGRDGECACGGVPLLGGREECACGGVPLLGGEEECACGGVPLLGGEEECTCGGGRGVFREIDFFFLDL